MKTRSFVYFICLFLFFLKGKAESFKYQPGPYQGTDVWLSSYYDYGSDYGVDDQYLRVGGWGDEYMAALMFDLDGLPRSVKRVVVKLYNEDLSGSSRPTSMDLHALSHPWSESDGYYTILWSGYELGRIPSPDRGEWYSVDITEQYRKWKSGTRKNFGLMFSPRSTNNRFNYFRSSDYSDKNFRPYFHIEYEPRLTPPDFKLPLPGGNKWCVTTEIGGGDEANPNYRPKSHTDLDYFSIDLSWRNSGSYRESSQIPVYAAASGYVVVSGESSWNGNYVVIDHDGDKNISTGYTTRYLHLISRSKLRVNQFIPQGGFIGYMGDTGEGMKGKKHLHFGVRYNNKGYSDTEELTWVKVEDIPLKQYMTEGKNPNNRHQNSFYKSTNTN